MSANSSANGGDDAKVRSVTIEGVEIKYRTKAAGRDWTYVDLDDPEVLAEKINKQRNKKLSATERGNFQIRLAQRLQELDYQGIPEVEPELSTFRAKHVLQCFQVRLADVWERLKVKGVGPFDRKAFSSERNRVTSLANAYVGAIHREKIIFKKIHDDIKTFDPGDYTEELKKLSDIIDQLTQLKEDYKDPRKYVADHYTYEV